MRTGHECAWHELVLGNVRLSLFVQSLAFRGSPGFFSGDTGGFHLLAVPRAGYAELSVPLQSSRSKDLSFQHLPHGLTPRVSSGSCPGTCGFEE